MVFAILRPDVILLTNSFMSRQDGLLITFSWYIILPFYNHHVTVGS